MLQNCGLRRGGPFPLQVQATRTNSAVPKNRNTREENAAIKAGEVPEGWADNPAERSQKGEPRVATGSRPVANEDRWTKKHGKGHYGHKKHVNVDRQHKLVRR